MSDEVQVFLPQSHTHPPSLRDFAAIFFRHQRLLVCSFLAVFAVGLSYAIFVPSYKAEMKLLVRRGRIDPAVTPTETAPPLLEREEITEEELNSQAELLHDEDILRTVVLETGLDKKPSLLAWLQGGGGEKRTAMAVKRLAAQLEVQPLRKSQLIAVSYKSAEPRLSATVLKSLAEAYLAKQTEIRRPNGQQIFFDEQMRLTRHALESAQHELAAFMRRKKVASAPLERDLTLQKLSEAEAADLGLQASIAEDAERIRSLAGKLRELPERQVVQVKNADNPQLQEKLRSRLLDLELKRTELLTKFQPSYRLVAEVDQQIAQAKAAIEAQDLKPLRDETTEANPDYEWANSQRIKSLVELDALQKKHATARRNSLSIDAGRRGWLRMQSRRPTWTKN